MSTLTQAPSRGHTISGTTQGYIRSSCQARDGGVGAGPGPAPPANIWKLNSSGVVQWDQITSGAPSLPPNPFARIVVNDTYMYCIGMGAHYWNPAARCVIKRFDAATGELNMSGPPIIRTVQWNLQMDYYGNVYNSESCASYTDGRVQKRDADLQLLWTAEHENGAQIKQRRGIHIPRDVSSDSILCNGPADIEAPDGYYLHLVNTTSGVVTHKSTAPYGYWITAYEHCKYNGGSYMVHSFMGREVVLPPTDPWPEVWRWGGIPQYPGLYEKRYFLDGVLYCYHRENLVGDWQWGPVTIETGIGQKIFLPETGVPYPSSSYLWYSMTEDGVWKIKQYTNATNPELRWTWTGGTHYYYPDQAAGSYYVECDAANNLYIIGQPSNTWAAEAETP